MFQYHIGPPASDGPTYELLDHILDASDRKSLGWILYNSPDAHDYFLSIFSNHNPHTVIHPGGYPVKYGLESAHTDPQSAHTPE